MVRAKRLSSRPVQQQGAALLMAMIIVTLVATFSASMVWQQWRAVQIEAAERVQAQSSWVLIGALDWARLILKEDKRNGGPDSLGEPWAIPLAEARLSSFLATDQDNSADDAPEAFLSGQVEDMTSRYNLRNILSDQGDVVPEELAVLKQLCELAGVPSTLANTLADAYRKATLAAQGDDPDTLAKLGGSAARAMAPLLPQSMDQLTWLGLDAGTVEKLKPYLTLLPERTQVNINTAPKEVIASVIDGLDLARAARIVQARQRNAFKAVDEVTSLLAMPSLNLTRVSIASDFFEVRGRLRYDDNIIEQRHLVQRTGDDVVVRSRARFAGVDKAYEGSPPP